MLPQRSREGGGEETCTLDDGTSEQKRLVSTEIVGRFRDDRGQVDVRQKNVLSVAELTTEECDEDHHLSFKAVIGGAGPLQWATRTAFWMVPRKLRVVTEVPGKVLLWMKYDWKTPHTSGQPMPSDA
jgi:hypothetical protein